MRFRGAFAFAAVLTLVPPAWSQFKIQLTLEKLSSADVSVRRAAMEDFANTFGTNKVQEYSNELLPVLVKGVSDTDPNVRLQAFSALNILAHAMVWSRNPKQNLSSGKKITIDLEKEPKLRGKIISALSDPDARIREGATGILGMGYRPSKETEELLLTQLQKETSVKVRKSIQKGLGAGRYSSSDTVSALIGMLDEKDDDTRGKAARFLAEIKDLSALPKVIEKLRKDNSYVRRQCAMSISAYGPSAAPYLSDLEKALNSEKDPVIRHEIESSVRRIKDLKSK